MSRLQAPASDRAPRIVAIDDDPFILQALTRMLQREALDVKAFENGLEALEAIAKWGGGVDLVFLDVHMPMLDGFELLHRLRSRWPDLPVIMLSGANDSVRTAVDAIRAGAYDYLTKPLPSLEQIRGTIARALQCRREVANGGSPRQSSDPSAVFAGIIGESEAMQHVLGIITRVAPTDATVLLLGESGTGKELLARAVHTHSARAKKPFIPINCSALTETLLEAELFGHVRGAFSGASANRAGLFEEASGGTLFMDEIGDMSPATQVRLLRVLQEGEIKPVGSSEVRKVDVRVIAATNRDLRADMQAGRFREDLFFRLNVVAIRVPPLRERPRDILVLANHFITKYCEKYKRPFRPLEPATAKALQEHEWPGNIRELENTIQSAVVLASERTLRPEDLAPLLAHHGERHRPVPFLDFTKPFCEAKEIALDSFERTYIEGALVRSGGNVAEAARICGLDKTNFRRIVQRRGINVSSFREWNDTPSSRPSHT